MVDSFLRPLSIAIVCIFTACSEQGGDPVNDHSSQEQDEKPIQHLKLEAITSGDKAAAVFAKEVAFITGREALTPAVMHEIHMSTYSLEIAVAYYAENSESDKKALAEQIAVVVEAIHLASENNRAEDTKKYIDQLAELANKFQG